MSLVEFSHFESLLVRDTVALDRLGYGPKHIFRAKRLGEKLHRASFHGLNRHGNVTVASHKNDGETDPYFHKLCLKFEPGQTGHADIKNQARWHFWTRKIEKLLG